MAQTGAQLLVQCLEKHGVEFIWAIPGAKIDAVFDALVDSSIKVIVCRHEQNAAFIAAAYGRLTGKPGVVLVTSGPGVSNLATGLLTATTEGDPVIAIGGNVPRSMKLKESHQNTDNATLMAAATKSSVEVSMTENIPEMLDNAFRTALQPRAGAAFISVPQDILMNKTKIVAKQPASMVSFAAADEELIEQAADLINNAQHPVILLGQEASRPENTAAIRHLLTRTPLATVSTYQAAGVISRELVRCFVGRIGLFKNQPGDKLLDTADVVITIGYNPVEYDPETWNTRANKTILHLDYNPAKIHTAYTPKMELIGDIAKTVQQLASQLDSRCKLADEALIEKLQQELQDKIRSGSNHSGSPIHPLRFIHDLRTVVDDDAIVISDVGSHYMWLSRYFFSYQPHHLLFSNGQQTLGVALPWAMACNYAAPGKKVVSVSGDGGFLFSAMELETAVREKLNFVHFVWCDSSYNMVKEQQLLKYRRESAVEFGHVDIVKFAESFGATGYRIHDSDELIPVLQKTLTVQGPVLVEVPIDYSDNPELFKMIGSHVGN